MKSLRFIILSILFLLCVTAGLLGFPSARSYSAEEPAAAETAAPASDSPTAALTRRLTRWEKMRGAITVPNAGYVGTDTCSLPICHGDTVRTWRKLPHSRYLLNAKTFPEEQRGCEGCHGPASLHFTDPSSPTTMARLSRHPEYVTALCNRCHHNGIEETHYVAGVHLKEGISCGTCHDVHRSHGTVRLLRGTEVHEVWRNGQRRIRAPKPAASGEGDAAMVESTDAANGSAATASEEAPALSPASAPRRPAVKSERRQSPTDLIGAIAELPDELALPADVDGTVLKKNRGARTGFSGLRSTTSDGKINELCLSCHPKVMGEMRLNSHHPVYEGRMSCADCHDPHSEIETEQQIAIDENRCMRCHTDKRGPFIYEHDMLATGDACATCHRPHGSPNRNLHTLNGRALCLQCHNDIHLDPEHQFRPGSCWRSGCHADIHGSNYNRYFLHTKEILPFSTGRRNVLLGAGPVNGWPLLPSHVSAGGSRPDWSSRLSPVSMLLAMAPENADTSPETPDAPADAAPAEGASGEGETTEGAAASGEGGAESSPSDLFHFDLVGAYQNLNPSGNRQRYSLYNIKPSGYFIDALRFSVHDDRHYGFGDLLWAGFPETRQRLSLNWESPVSAKTRKQLRYTMDRAGFFLDPSVDRRDPQHRRTDAFSFQVTPGSDRAEISLLADRTKLVAPSIARLAEGATQQGLDYAVESYGPLVRVPIGSGAVRLQYVHERFWDDSGYQPMAGSDRVHASYSGPVSANALLFGTASHVSFDQAGLLRSSKREEGRLGLVYNPSRSLRGTFLISSESIRQPHTRTALTTENNQLLARLRYRPSGLLSLEGAYQRQDLTRLNNVQNFRDTPRWDGGYLALRLHPFERVSVFARHRIRRMDDAPEAAIPNLTNLLPIFYDEEDVTDAALTILLPADAQLYANYGRNKRFNDARKIGSTATVWNAGITLPVGQTVSLSADWTRQNWAGIGTELTEDPLRLNFGRPLVTDGTYWNLGISYAPGSDTATLSLYRFDSTGGESLRGRGLLFGYERPIWSGILSRLQAGWDDYDDRVVPGLNFTDHFIRLDLARRF